MHVFKVNVFIQAFVPVNPPQVVKTSSSTFQTNPGSQVTDPASSTFQQSSMEHLFRLNTLWLRDGTRSLRLLILLTPKSTGQNTALPLKESTEF